MPSGTGCGARRANGIRRPHAYRIDGVPFRARMYHPLTELAQARARLYDQLTEVAQARARLHYTFTERTYVRARAYCPTA